MLIVKHAIAIPAGKNEAQLDHYVTIACCWNPARIELLLAVHSLSLLCRGALHCLQSRAVTQTEYPGRHYAAKQPGHTNCLSLLLAPSAIFG